MSHLLAAYSEVEAFDLGEAHVLSRAIVLNAAVKVVRLALLRTFLTDDSWRGRVPSRHEKCHNYIYEPAVYLHFLPPQIQHLHDRYRHCPTQESTLFGKFRRHALKPGTFGI